jgi:hypothetical protein
MKLFGCRRPQVPNTRRQPDPHAGLGNLSPSAVFDAGEAPGIRNLNVLGPTGIPLMYSAQLRLRALLIFKATILACATLAAGRVAAQESPPSAEASRIWTCNYVASTPQGPLQITAKFQVIGDELAEIETIPKGLNFSERYKILENTPADIVAAISIAKFSDHPPPAIGAVVIMIAKQNGLFQQSGSILGLRTGEPTLGHCESQ